MIFPIIVYKCPGQFQRSGGTYDFKPANDEAELNSLLDDGWYKTLPEAIEPKQDEPKQEDSSPTRDELEQKAKELGIDFDGRTSDKKLGEKIAKALGE